MVSIRHVLIRSKPVINIDVDAIENSGPFHAVTARHKYTRLIVFIDVIDVRNNTERRVMLFRKD